MPSLRPPSAESLRAFLQSQQPRNFTYDAVGATAATPPAGYVVDHMRVELGAGEQTFLAAVVALQRWNQFRLGWVTPWPGDTPIRTGEVVAILGHAMGCWWLNACRIVYVVDDAGPVHRFGFAYGTLPGHAESGEERFQIEWNRDDDRVWYDILAFSRPQLLLTRLGYPFVRRLQKRFARDSATAMQCAVKGR